MKKLFALILALVMVMAMTACNNTSNPGGTTTAPTEPKEPGVADPLTFKEGSTTAMCPVCKEEVLWKELTQAVHGAFGVGRLQGNEHYYLAEDITYEGTEADGFIIGPSLLDGAPLSSCIHLNGHNVTSTKSPAFVGYPGILNVMGSGTVAGYNATGGQGAAVVVNTAYETSVINLYSGTYTKVAGNDTAAVISIWSDGGVINMYEDVKVVGFGGGHAVRVNNAQKCNTTMNIQGATIEGGMLRVLKNSGKGFTTKVTLTDVKLDEFKLSATDAVTISGDTVIGKFEITDEAKFTLGELTKNASFAVMAEGAFTNPTNKANDYLSYFKPYEGYKDITVVENALVTGAVAQPDPTAG